MDIFSIAAGAAGVLGAYFLYLVATKGWTWVKTKFSSIEATAVADLKTAIATVEKDVAAIKAKVGMV